MLSTIMALMALAIDMMLPAFDDMRDAFGLGDDSTEVAQVITVFFLGLAVAQLVWGPMSDRFGRKPILYVGLTIYALGAVLSALAPSFGLVLVSRFIWGTGAAATRVVATAIIRDSFSGSRMAEAMSQIMAVFVLVPVFAPSIGAGLIAVLPWRSVFWFCVVWVIILAAWTLRLGETLDPANRRPLDLKPIAAGFGTVMRTRITAGYTAATLFFQGVFIAYLGSSERIINDIYDREGQFPFIFGAIAVLFGLSALINGRIVGRFGTRRIIGGALGAVLVLASLLVGLALVTNGRPSFWIFIPLLALMLSCFMLLMPNLNTEALEPMGQLAGTAASLTGAVRIAGGALLGAIVDSQLGDTVTPFAVASLIFVLCALASTAYAQRAS